MKAACFVGAKFHGKFSEIFPTFFGAMHKPPGNSGCDYDAAAVN